MLNTFNFGGRTYEYSPITIFYLELGRLDNAYTIEKTYTLDEGLGEPHQRAIDDYTAFEVNNGYKKRLSMSTAGKKTVLAKHITRKCNY